jgi:SAM domain (Sterile alpha motif)
MIEERREDRRTDVETWLRNLGLGQYDGAFRDNSVDAEVLPRLTAEDVEDLGIESVGHRRKLLDAITDLKPSALVLAFDTQIVDRPRRMTASPSVTNRSGKNAYFFRSLRINFSAACLVSLGLDQHIEDLRPPHRWAAKRRPFGRRCSDRPRPNAKSY